MKNMTEAVVCRASKVELGVNIRKHVIRKIRTEDAYQVLEENKTLSDFEHR